MTSQSAFDLRAAVQSGDISSLEATEGTLNLAESLNPNLGAFITVAAELALDEARAADERFVRIPRSQRSDELPPLHGVPTAHKDLVRVCGMPTTHGSRAVPHEVSTVDDPLVGALRRAGMISIGKTQVPEFGLTAYSENLVAPPARNPIAPALAAGGSSGGSAAAVAAGILPIAPGSDAGGSIRIPAAACGLVGLKLGRGAIPHRVWPETGKRAFPGMSVPGPLARTPLDAALLLDALMLNRSEQTVRAVQRAGDLNGLRIGVSLASPFDDWRTDPLPDTFLLAIEHAAARMHEAGHRVETADIPYPQDYPEHFTSVWTSALGDLRVAPNDEHLLMPLTRHFLERSRATPPEMLAASVAWLRDFAENMTARWGAYDVVITPTLGTPPPPVGAFFEGTPEDDYRLQCRFAPYSSMVNVVGVPAVSVPLPMRDAANIPASVQLIGRHGSEPLLLQLAEQLVQ